MGVLKAFPDESVHCVVTSPPYWGLRDYGLPPVPWPEVEYAPMPGLPPVRVPAWEGCLDEETEILTYDGWKKYDEIKDGDLVTTFNLQKQTLEYQPIKEIFIDYYDGEMISIKNKHVDQLLTPNHRVLHKYRLHSGSRCWISDWQFTEAKNVEYKLGLILPVAAPYDGKSSIGEDLAELIGWILTDGTLSTSRGYRITIYQSKEKGIKRICYLLNRLGIKYSIYRRKEKTNYTKDGKEPKERSYIRFSGEWAKRIRAIIPVKKSATATK